jgi:hypothetical protein
MLSVASAAVEEKSAADMSGGTSRLGVLKFGGVALVRPTLTLLCHNPWL